MKIIIVCLTGILLWMAPISAQNAPIIRPGSREAQREENQPEVPPLFKPTPKPIDPAKLKGEAEELSKLAASIPNDVNQASKGLLAADLDQRLKRIEKLSKQLRRELSH